MVFILVQKVSMQLSLTVEMNIISIYPPHFFKRYRERIVKDESISNEEIIRQYFKNDWGFMGAVVNEDFESVYHCFETENKNDKVSFVAATSQGYCFGEKQGNVNIIKTIISEDMLFENQKIIFDELKKAFKELIKRDMELDYCNIKSKNTPATNTIYTKFALTNYRSNHCC